MSKIDVAIVGATGMVGAAMLEILEQRAFPVAELYCLASESSAGASLMLGNRSVLVEELGCFDFSQVQLVFFCAPAPVAAQYVPVALAAGCWVIDNSSQFRADEQVPLVVPEVNSETLSEFADSGARLVASPGAAAVQLLMALKPLDDAVGVESVNVATYQAVSVHGRAAVTALATQTARMLNGQPAEAAVFDKQMAFNLIAQQGTAAANGFSEAELDLQAECQRVLAAPALTVNATCVTVPVFYGLSEAVQLRTRQSVTAEWALEILATAPGLQLSEGLFESACPSPVGDAAGEDLVQLGRVRQDISGVAGLNLWLVADNVRKGAALNSIQIAEFLLKTYF